MDWSPAGIFVLLAAALGFYLDVGKVRSRWKSRSKKNEVKLQYTRVVTAVAFDRPAVPLTAEVHVFLDNPNDVTLRVEPEYMRTTFDGRADQSIPKGTHTRDVAAGARNVGVRGQMIRLGRHKRGEVIRGRVDWKINYGAVLPDEEPELSEALELHGDIEIHWVNGEFQSRWAPDLGSEIPALEEDRIVAAENGEFWSRDR